MTSTDAKARFAAARVARLATVTAEQHAHVVPCCFAMFDETIVSAVDAKPKTTLALRRLANIAAHPHVSLVVDHYADDWSQLWWVRVDGIATIQDAGDHYDAALDTLAAKYPQYQSDRPTGALIMIEPVTWRSWGGGTQR